MEYDLSEAVEHQQAGRYADAARFYHGLLAREPDHADALHLFGVLHHQCGHSGRAAEMIGRAVALRPGAAAFHSNLSEVLRTLSENEAAAESAREALRLQADYPEAANNLGLALQALGRRTEAVDAFETALRLRPEFALARNNLGIALKELGRDDEAFQAFRESVELDPGLAVARANLGQSFVDVQDADQGLEHCLEGVRLQPDLAAAHNNLGNAYRLLERRPEAYAAYAEALRLSPGIAGARVHSNLGLTLHGEGLHDRAFACLRRATELAPEDPEVWRHLAEAHAADEEYAAALPCCERVVELAPDRAQDHTNLGWALQQEGRIEEAAGCYRRALELQPNLVDALLNTGNLHEELGEMAEAEACYRQAIEGAPHAVARLATLLRGRLPEEDRDALRIRLNDPSLNKSARAGLLYGLAQACDGRGDYGEAASCLREANALTLAQRAERKRNYSSDEHTRFVDRMIEGFSEEVFRRLRGTGVESRQPVFVFGMPRSGTTLVEQVLASHSQVHGAGELRLARQTFDAIPAAAGKDDGSFPCIEPCDVEATVVGDLAGRHLAALQKIVERSCPGISPDRIVDKMPDNYMYLGMLAIAFPQATFIHVRRDPRDIALSCWMTSFRSIRWANDIGHIAGRIQAHHRLMDHWRAILPVPLHEVVYEELVDNFEPEARRLIDACGLEWDPACLEFHRTERPVRTASVTQVRQPIYRRSVARWRRYEADLAELFDQLPVD